MSSVNRYLGARLLAGELEVDYLLDLAELPAYAEIERLDTDHDERVTPAERDRYLDTLRGEIVARMSLTVDGRAVVPREVSRAMEAPPGQNGLSTLRVALQFRAALPALPEGATERCTVVVSDRYRAERPGWRELAAEGSAHARLLSSTLPRDAPRAGGRLEYPTDPRGAERPRLPRYDLATFVFERGVSSSAGGGAASPMRRAAERRGPLGDGQRLVALLRDPLRSPWALFTALAVAFGLGASHALAPGHGKTLVAAYLVGRHGRPRDAVALGLAVTVSHTATVFAVGALALAIERAGGSERLLRSLELSSGVLVLAVGLSQLPARWRRWRSGATEDHAHEAPPDLGWRSLVAMGLGAGMVPCPGALVLLLSAISIRRVGVGMVLLVAFSLGLATVLTAVGLAMVTAGRGLLRFDAGGRWARSLPVVASAAVLVVGALLVLRALGL